MTHSVQPSTHRSPRVWRWLAPIGALLAGLLLGRAQGHRAPDPAPAPQTPGSGERPDPPEPDANADTKDAPDP